MSDDSQSNGLPIARSQQHARRALVYGRTLILLDVEAEHLDDVLDAVAEELATDPTTGYRDSVKESLRRLGDSGPELLDGGVAVVHDSLPAVDGVPVDVDVLVRTQEPLALRDDEGDAVRFIWVLITSEKTHPHVGAAAEFAHLMHHEDLAQPALAAETPGELAAAFEHALKREIDLQRIPPELERTGRLFGGMIRDLKRRAPHYIDDFRQGFRVKVLGSVLFMFVACLAAAVAFGGLLSTLTDGQIGAVETLLASAVCGVVWSLCAGQPLPIVGATGPNVIFTGILYGLCQRFDVPFLPTVACTGLWAGFFLLVLAATDASALIRYFTRFTDEVFAALIGLIFISEAAYDLTGAFQDSDVSEATALFSLLLALGTTVIAIALARFRRLPYLRAKFREFLSDFGPAIAILAMTLIAHSWSSLELPKLEAARRRLTVPLLLLLPIGLVLNLSLHRHALGVRVGTETEQRERRGQRRRPSKHLHLVPPEDHGPEPAPLFRLRARWRKPRAPLTRAGRGASPEGASYRIGAIAIPRAEALDRRPSANVRSRPARCQAPGRGCTVVGCARSSTCSARP